MNKNTAMLTQRRKMFTVSLIVWLALCFWTASAFWQHLQHSVQPEYFWMSCAGAMASEFLVLFFIFEYCFVKKIAARKHAIFCSFALSAFMLLHSGAVRGIEGAKAAQIDAEQRYANNAGRLIGANKTRTGTRSANQAAAKELKELTKEGHARIENSSIFPAWYIRDWMYSAIFIVGLLLFVWYEWIQITDPTLDADYDGIDDRQQSLTPATGKV